MARITFIRLQLGNLRAIVKNFIRIYLRKSSCVRFEIAVLIPSIHLSNKKTAIVYLYPFLSFSVHKFCGPTDIFPKNFLFLPDQEYIYMSIPISIISQIPPPL